MENKKSLRLKIDARSGWTFVIMTVIVATLLYLSIPKRITFDSVLSKSGNYNQKDYDYINSLLSSNSEDQAHGLELAMSDKNKRIDYLLTAQTLIKSPDSNVRSKALVLISKFAPLVYPTYRDMAEEDPKGLVSSTKEGIAIHDKFTGSSK